MKCSHPYLSTVTTKIKKIQSGYIPKSQIFTENHFGKRACSILAQ
jgi:hypothetical protein